MKMRLKIKIKTKALNLAPKYCIKVVIMKFGRFGVQLHRTEIWPTFWGPTPVLKNTYLGHGLEYMVSYGTYV